ncbi:RusA family crossover junction endodeoxyribonuclease [Rhizobiaceae bacterium n13]|uniref:RusA family crossover junction endodeoxyribonuclease n=1 Tax=Ferirhizobium litorale TaxID=2927786 RepID=UPI0024B2F53F|nr:RusA family crossover junction endodeoxyribonuclease [Fererhizobium litorale]MDI7862559.1 RusA family crossover junction endodeoxyribonuclease [Fererhizobium litorale]
MAARIKFIIPGDVVPWARAGGGKTTAKFTPRKQRDYMGMIRAEAHEQMRAFSGPLPGPLQLKVVAVYLWPKSTTKARLAAIDGAWKTTKPDSDNITKIVKDALNTIAYVDDAQVSFSSCWKILGPKAGLIVEVISLEGIPAPAIAL